MKLTPKTSNNLSLKRTLVYGGIGLAISAIIGGIIFFTANFGNNEEAYAAPTYYNANTGGAWEDPSTWGGLDPGTSTVKESVFTINGNVLRSGSLSFAMDNSLTINSDTLEILGDVSIAKDMDFQINGTLIIRGELNVAKEAILSVNGSGNVIVEGPATIGKTADFNIDGVVDFKDNLTFDKDADLNLNGSGVLNVGGNLAFDQGAYINNNGTINVGNNLTLSDAANGSDFIGNGTVNIGGSGCEFWDGNGSGCTENAVLPVELLSFTATPDNGQVIIQWETATELNNDYFTIERSVDGREFNAIVEITGNGTTKDISKYEFVDSNPLNGQSYYRLKQTDFDGTTEIFRPVYVDIKVEAENTIEVYPNPLTHNRLFVRLDTPTEGFAYVFDQSGNEVANSSLDDFNTETEISLPANLKTGIYIVKVNTGTHQESFKVIKR